MDFFEALLFVFAALTTFYLMKGEADEIRSKKNRCLRMRDKWLGDLRPQDNFFLKMGNNGKKRYSVKPVYRPLIPLGFILIADQEGNSFELPASTPVEKCPT